MKTDLRYFMGRIVRELAAVFLITRVEVVYLAVMLASGVIVVSDGVSNDVRMVALLVFLVLWTSYFFVKPLSISGERRFYGQREATSTRSSTEDTLQDVKSIESRFTGRPAEDAAVRILGVLPRSERHKDRNRLR